MRTNGGGNIVSKKWKEIKSNPPTEIGEYLIAGEKEGPYCAGWNGEEFVYTDEELFNYRPGEEAVITKANERFLTHWREMPKGLS